jgi:hypothetical protein
MKEREKGREGRDRRGREREKEGRGKGEGGRCPGHHPSQLLLSAHKRKAIVSFNIYF